MEAVEWAMLSAYVAVALLGAILIFILFGRRP